MAMVFLAIMGKRFADAGLADLLIESGVLGPSTVCSVLSGKHYNRVVCAHKAAMEALFRTSWQKFEVRLNEHAKEGKTCTDCSILLDVLRKRNFKPIISRSFFTVLCLWNCTRHFIISVQFCSPLWISSGCHTWKWSKFFWCTYDQCEWLTGSYTCTA